MATRAENDDDAREQQFAAPLPPPDAPAAVNLSPHSVSETAPGHSSGSDHSGRSQTSRSAQPIALPTGIADLLDADGSLVIVVNRDGSVRTANTVGLRVLGADSLEDFTSDSAPSATLRSLLDHVPKHLLAHSSTGSWQGDFDHTNIAGEWEAYRATVTVHVDDHDSYMAVIAHDVTAERRETGHLRHQARHDPLTGLANRRQALATLSASLAEHRGKSGHVATLFVDLDRLRYVNHALGHHVGDQLLVSTAQRLTDAVRPADHIARIGGDEFLVVCRDMPDAVTALALAERVRLALNGRLRVDDLDVNFSVSLGIALSDVAVLDATHDDAASLLISNAETAMYEAKRDGRRRSALFTPQMRSAAREQTELAAALSVAIARKDLTVEFQPVFSAITQRAEGAEALVRWQHPARGRIDPAMFVTIAEESGSIGVLGDLVLREALESLRGWLDSGLVDETFAVHANVSHVQLASGSFVHQVLGILHEFRIDPSQLVLEARESALGSPSGDVQRTVRALRHAGVRLAIDNFGTGSNALSILTDIGADLLKLDGSLALPSGSSESDTRVVRAVVLLAHALEMRVVAERVSGAEQLKRLRAAGCDLVQGNLLAPPSPASQFDPARHS